MKNLYFIPYDENPIYSMKNLISAFLGWCAGLLTLAKAPIFFLNWWPFHVADMPLLINGIIKAVTIAGASWGTSTSLTWARKRIINRRRKNH